MNKSFLISLLIMGTFNFTHSISDAKKQKVIEIFELTHDMQQFRKVWEPLFTNFNITDEEAKKKALNKYLENIKKDFIVVYDKFFNDTEIDEILKYNRSAIGKKFVSVSVDLNTELGKAYGSMMGIIQELTPKPEVPAASTSSASNVLHFDDISKGKTDEEVRNLFNKELNPNGLTVVKFSAVWCGPCKSYAPDFEKVASELKEIIVGDKKTTIKYIATDIEATPAIAQDYSVVSIPTTIFYKNGQKIDSQTGYMNPHALTSRIQELAQK